jgi:hypothetical protein
MIVSKQLKVEITTLVFRPTGFLFNSLSKPIAKLKSAAMNNFRKVSKDEMWRASKKSMVFPPFYIEH